VLCSLSPSGRAQRAQGARGRSGSAPTGTQRQSCAPWLLWPPSASRASRRSWYAPPAAWSGACRRASSSCRRLVPSSSRQAKRRHYLARRLTREFCPGQNTPCSPPDPVFLRGAKDALLRVLHGGHTGPPRREKMAASIPSWMGGAVSAPPPIQAPHTPPRGKKGALDTRHAGFL